MPAVATKLITAEEFMNMPDPPDGSQQELVRGEIVTMPPPKGRHGTVCAEFVYQIKHHNKVHKLGHVTSNDAGVILERDPDTVRGPDAAFWSYARLKEMPNAYPEIPPDLVVEVVSPDDRHTKVTAKVREYLHSGVRLVWVADPDVRTVTVYRSRETARTLEENDTLDGEDVLPGFKCRIADLFA